MDRNNILQNKIKNQFDVNCTVYILSYTIEIKII